MKTKLLFWLCGGILSAPAPAFALTVGQCGAAATIRAELAAEQQSTIIIGNRSGYGSPTTLAFTSNADGSKGYLVRGDKPLGQQATVACIDAAYGDARINDVTKLGVPAWAMITSDPATVDRICQRDRLGYQEMCKANDERLTNLEGNGQRVLFVATGSAVNPRDDTVRSGQRIIVTYSSAKDGGLVMASTPEGANYILSAYSPISLTQHAEGLKR